MEKFRQAVSWHYHGEDLDSIRNELGYKGSMEEVIRLSNFFWKMKINHDEVYGWANAK
jgi:hypothetical protein